MTTTDPAGVVQQTSVGPFTLLSCEAEQVLNVTSQAGVLTLEDQGQVELTLVCANSLFFYVPTAHLAILEEIGNVDVSLVQMMQPVRYGSDQHVPVRFLELPVLVLHEKVEKLEGAVALEYTDN